ncbi:MAG: hypothetical protein KGH94_04995 [Candidatus Micrarchaeota archaeon]|nr:hypothetical protein [Candidatus Micrarchaeota archaeon]
MYPYIIIGLIATIIGLIGYVPYIWKTFSGKNKPHAFTWLIWSLLLTIGFLAAALKGGGPGTWAVGVPAALELLVFIIAIFKGEKDIDRMDVATLMAALLGIVLWLLTTNPLWAVIIVASVDMIGYIPTIRKAYKKPREESITVYTFSSVSFLVSLFALRAITLTTFLYPLTLFLSNGLFATFVVARRYQLKKRRKRAN